MEEFNLATNGRVCKESKVGPRKPAEWALVGALFKHWGMFKGESEPHEGTARVCLGPRWVPSSKNCARLVTSRDMSGWGVGPHTLHVSETHSAKTRAAG